MRVFLFTRLAFARTFADFQFDNHPFFTYFYQPYSSRVLLSTMRKLKHLLEYAGLRLLVQAVALLSRRAILALGAALGRFTFSVLRIRRRVALDNLRQAFPEKPEQEIQAIAKRNYENFGMMMLEYLRLPMTSGKMLDELVTFRTPGDAAPWQQAMQRSKGAVCMTGHFGNWEYMGAMVAQHFPMAFLYQPQSNPYTDALIRRTREKANMLSISRNSLRDILKALRQKKFVAVLADQDAGSSGIFVNFMGRPASTAQGPAAFVLKTGAPILFVVSLRQPGGEHLIESEALYFDDLPAHWSEAEKLRHITQAWTDVLEKYVRRYPDHWFWMHRRWKTPAAAAPAVAATTREEVQAA